MTIEKIRPLVEKLLIETQEDNIQWKISYDAINLIEFQCIFFTTEKKHISYFLEVDVDNMKTTFTIRYGPLDGTNKFKDIFEIDAKKESSIFDLKYLLMNLYNKKILKHA